MRLRHRIIDATDEWFHRHGFGVVKAEGKKATVWPWWGHLAKPLCDARERRYMGSAWYEQYPNTTSTTTNSSLKTLRWDYFGHRKAPQ